VSLPIGVTPFLALAMGLVDQQLASREIGFCRWLLYL
jgi:hypothetical protein